MQTGASTDDYDYRGLIAQLWDLFVGDTSRWPDRFFYLEAVKRYGGPVLDVGCGTGRLLLDFLSRGIDADGVDSSDEMLVVLRHKSDAMNLRPGAYLQPMEALDLPRRYRTILVPSGSFQILVDPAVARQAMARFAHHLLPGGALVVPFDRLWKEGDPLVFEAPVREVVRPEDGARVRRRARNVYDPATGYDSIDVRYEVTLHGRVIAEERHHRSPNNRSYTQAESRQLFEEAGLSNIQIYSGYTWEPAQEGDEWWTVVGRRPNGLERL